MNLTNYYWYFKSAIPERVCDDIIKYGNAQREQIALTGGQTQKLAELEAKEKAKPKKPKKKKIISEATAHLSDEYLESLDPAEKLEEKELNDLRKKRDSNIAWLNDRWIYKEVQPYVHQANASAGWNFDWNFSESCQFTKYKLNQFYDWHCDSWDQPYNNPDNKDTHGKLESYRLLAVYQIQKIIKVEN
jgi:PKHD-type hydroxylase